MGGCSSKHEEYCDCERCKSEAAEEYAEASRKLKIAGGFFKCSRERYETLHGAKAALQFRIDNMIPRVGPFPPDYEWTPEEVAALTRYGELVAAKEAKDQAAKDQKKAKK